MNNQNRDQAEQLKNLIHKTMHGPFGKPVAGFASLLMVFFTYTHFFGHHYDAKYGNLDCTQTKPHPVLDQHMSGLFEQGSAVEVFDDYYKCNEVKRGDVVLFKFSDHVDPVVRVVRGVPGDTYTVVEDPADALETKAETLPKEKSKNKNVKNKTGYKISRWHILINGKPVNAGDKEYFIESNTVPPLKTYEIAERGVLSKDEYILLSNKPPGLSDSSNLGLVSKKNLAGRVKIK